MSVMTEYGSRPQDVGEILVKVHDDLQQLREKLLAQKDREDSIDLSALDNAITKTEYGLRNQAEQVLKQVNNQVRTLPSLNDRTDQHGVETTWDTQSRGDLASRKTRSDRPAVTDFSSGPSGGQSISLQRLSDGSTTTQPTHSSPGEQFKQIRQMRVLQNPHNPRNREVVHDNYGIQLPLINTRGPTKPQQLQILKGSTVDPLVMLPRANRADPQLLPPPISEKDAQRGILSLLERGLIPPAAQLTLDPPPVVHQTAPLHDPQTKDRSVVPFQSETNYSHANVKRDPHMRQQEDLRTLPSSAKSLTSGKLSAMSPDIKSRASSGAGRKHSAGKLKTPVSIKTLELPFQPFPPPTTPASGPDLKDKSYRFAIQNGKVRDQAQEFIVFKHHYCLTWGSIVSMLKQLEKMLKSYAVPIAFINGSKLADLSIEFELERSPTVQELLTVIVNREDVENIINRPGRRFVGPNGRYFAASKIQATYRMHLERQRYLDYRKKKWAAGVIAISWVMHVKMSKVRRQMATTKADQIENFRKKAKAFCKNWGRIKNSKRVVIHIPSLGYSLNLRQNVADFSLHQNLQMARLCDIRDPSVDVIYVSPVPISDEMAQYYSKLLGLKAAIDTGNVEDQDTLNDRFKIITPEAIKSFPAHKMCLSTLLKYSPKTLNRIRNLIRGREAYIVTGVPHHDDIKVAEDLAVPLLCPEPEIAHLYSTKSGSKRIFASAKVAMPPSEYDVYNLNQLHECLAQLVTDNLEVTRWLFKLDDEFDGRGIAYCDIAEHMPSYNWAVREAQRYGEKWNKKWAQEAACIKIQAELPEVLTAHAQPVNTKIYPTWEKFVEMFLSKGGIIEACPPSESVTALTVDMMIEPDGHVSMVCMGDQIHADSPYTCWGLSIPQSSVEPDELNKACTLVADACKARGVVGYFAIDFVTFIHPKTMQQELWAVDLNLSYSDSLAQFQLFQFVTGGTLDINTHYFDIPPPKKEKKSRRRRIKEEEKPVNTNRCGVMSTRLRHTNLSVVHYSVFFQMCRAHGIGYDIKEKQGTVFTLIDSATRANLGMITIGDNLQGTLATFARNLSVVHQEISAPNMQGESNFKPVIEDIEAILGTTVQNALDQDEQKEETS